MKFKECMEIKECKDIEKEKENEFQVNDIYNEIDDKMTPQQVQNFQKDRPSVIQETRGASLCNPMDLHVYETKKSALTSTEAAIILKTAHETAISRFKLCKNTVSSYPAADDEYYTHVSRGYKGLGDYRLLEKAHKEYLVHIKKEEDPVESRKKIFLRMVQEVDGSDSLCEKNTTKEDHQPSGIVDIAEALWRKGHVTFCNENQMYLVSNLTRKKVNVVTPRTETITVRGNKIVTKGTKRKSLV
ncbi:hypothetical protein QYM36_013029 [Artemia franciscana]|uniref:Uncharacterized protein n=1 Tax=Artemia franciscana TaxID=6661 RepID=A0AA88KYC5_ARTSF|nr:hypothetical protein QYM36_013029 [Artemia franciscana]